MAGKVIGPNNISLHSIDEFVTESDMKAIIGDSCLLNLIQDMRMSAQDKIGIITLDRHIGYGYTANEFNEYVVLVKKLSTINCTNLIEYALCSGKTVLIRSLKTEDAKESIDSLKNHPWIEYDTDNQILKESEEIFCPLSLRLYKTNIPKHTQTRYKGPDIAFSRTITRGLTIQRHGLNKLIPRNILSLSDDGAYDQPEPDNQTLVLEQPLQYCSMKGDDFRKSCIYNLINLCMQHEIRDKDMQMDA